MENNQLSHSSSYAGRSKVRIQAPNISVDSVQAHSKTFDTFNGLKAAKQPCASGLT